MVRREYASVVIVALLVVASGGATYAGGADQPYATAASDRADGERMVDDLLTRFVDGDEAGAVYVDRSGSAVFRYEIGHDSPAVIPIQGELGVETGTGLAHARYASDLEQVTVDGQALTGTATTWATPESITGTGQARLEEPDDLRSLSAELQGIRNADTESASLELSGAVANDTRPYDRLETSGTVETTATTITASGSMRTTVADDRTTADEPSPLADRRTVTITETGGMFRLQASESRTVGEWDRDRWATEADARTSLENRYDELAILLGGDATLELESYAFQDDGDQATVEVAYTVAFDDVEEGLADRIATELEATTDVDLDEHEARVIGDRLARTSIEEISVDLERNGVETDLEWDVELHDTDELVLGLVETSGSTDDDPWAGQYDAVRTALEAQQDAGLVRKATWEATVDHDDGETTVEAVAESTAENWTRYTAEREARGVDPVPRPTNATLTAATIDDDLAVQYEYDRTVGGAGPATVELVLADRGFGPAIDVAGVPVADAAFEVARADATVDDGGVELESAAALEDATAVEWVSGDGVTAVHADTTNERTTVYVTTDGFVDAEATVAEIRGDPRIGPSTHVYGPGEWDREFPSIDADEARAFLAVDADDDRDVAATVLPPALLVGGYGLAVVVPVLALCLPWRRATADYRDRAS